jgi:MarR family transcriptional regulator for hemolysin
MQYTLEQHYTQPGHLINRLSRLFARMGEPRMKALGFGVGQMLVLATLKDGAACTQTQLASIARIEQPSMAQMLTRMERDGLVQRAPDPKDKRSVLFSLTPEAIGRLPALWMILADCSAEALSPFTQEEAATLCSLLIRMVQHLEQVTEGAD